MSFTVFCLVDSGMSENKGLHEFASGVKIMTKLHRWRRSTQILARNAVWRLRNDFSPNAVPVFIVGVQRSGTTMLGECLEMNPEIRHHPEHDDRAFHDFILRDEDTIDELVRRCPHKLVVFKPLTDSHRVHDLITRFGNNLDVSPI